LTGQLAERWIARRHPPAAGPVTLRGSRVYILPTRQGWLFVSLLLVLFVGSLNYANSLAFALTFLLTGVGILSMWHTQRNLAGLRLAVGAPQPAFVGGEAHFAVALGNSGGQPRYSLLLSFAGAASVGADVPSQAEVEVELGVPAARRGRLEPGRLLIASRYPLGLFRAWSWVSTPVHTSVYPKPAGKVALPALADSPTACGVLRGNREEDFETLRPYRSGDAPRRIAWKASSRGNGLQTKVFGSAAGTRLWLTWPTGVGEVEYGLSQLCLWVLEASRSDREYGLRLKGVLIPPARGNAHRQRCLEALACYRSG
jgi:uncharacterized protein (DUF58 family)